METSNDEKVENATNSRPESPQTALPGEDQAAKAARPEREAEFKDYLRIFSYATKWDYVLMVAAALASLGAGTTLPLMNVVFGNMVGNFTDYFLPNTTVTKAEFQHSLNRLSLFIFILFIARFTLNYVSKFSFRLIGIRMSASIRLDYLRSLFSQSIHVLDSMPPGAAAGTITSTANVLQLGISEKLGTFLEFLSTIVTAIIVAFTFSWALTLVTGSVILFIALTLSILLPFIIKGQSRLTRAETKAGAVASEAFTSIRMVAACGAESRVAKRYSEWVDEAKKHGQFTSPLIAIQFGLVFFGLYGAFALAFWYGTKAFHDGIIDSVGTVIIVLMSVMMMVISLERMSTPMIAASKAMVAAAEFFAVIDAPRPKTGHLKAPDVSASEDIVFTGVDFAYPGRPHVKVLDGLDLTIEAGKVTAIVGPSGSGKSTIVGLVERWYTLHDQYIIAKAIEKDPKKKKAAEATPAAETPATEKKSFWARLKEKREDPGEDDEDDTESAEAGESTGPRVELKGTIETSGHSFDDINLKWWRAQIGLVQQEPFLFNDSIYTNVMHGLIGTEWENEPVEVKKELVREACKEAFADEFIDRLPDGYDTQVGDSGTKLSGGQRQRLAIARSIVKKPKILILDEATSAIDVRSEKIIQLALEKVSRGRTTIMIAHRLSTIRKADKIVVLQKGKLMEQGTHESLLLNEEGVYSGLVNAQRLALGGHDGGDDEGPESEEDIDAILTREKSAAQADAEDTQKVTKWKAKGLLGSFGRLLYEQKSKWPTYVITVIFAACAAASFPLQAYLFAQIIVVFNYTGEKFLHESRFWSLMWFVLAIGIGISYLILGYSATQLQHYICATYRKQYFEAMLYQKTDFFDEEENSTGSLSARVAGDPKQLEEMLGMNMAMVYSSMFQLIGALIIAFVYGWKLALVALCVTVPLGLAAGFFRFKYELQFEKMYAAVFAESSKWAAESIGAFRTVSALTLEDVITDRYETLLNQHVVGAYKKSRWSTLVFALSDSIGLACQALIFWYGGRLLATREYQLVNFFVCYMAVIQGAEAAGQGFSFAPNAAQSTGAANRILSIRESRNRDKADAKIPDVDGGARIEFRNVGFKYPTRNVSIFKNLNITIERGQFAALVGASGSGKTSIVSLLERFYDVQRGQILCNGTDIKDVNVYEYRKLLSLVAQEPTLFQGTIRDNILLGVDPKEVTDEQIHQVCRDASIHDFIVSLPDGYNTNVGSKGVALSGGQKQRLAIARALIRDPQILLLDEATSSLDSESEKAISAAIQKVAVGRTTVAVAHRLSTIQNADIIYVLGEGHVLEQGNHAELLKKRGVYWNMCHSQALDR